MAHIANAPAQGFLGTLFARIGAFFDRVGQVLEDARRLRMESEKRFPHTAE